MFVQRTRHARLKGVKPRSGGQLHDPRTHLIRNAHPSQASAAIVEDAHDVAV